MTSHLPSTFACPHAAVSAVTTWWLPPPPHLHARMLLHTVVLAGVAGLVAGALSMAVGEFVSVASQR